MVFGCSPGLCVGTRIALKRRSGLLLTEDEMRVVHASSIEVYFQWSGSETLSICVAHHMLPILKTLSLSTAVSQHQWALAMSFSFRQVADVRSLLPHFPCCHGLEVHECQLGTLHLVRQCPDDVDKYFSSCSALCTVVDHVR
jgi:hypothetical protein